MHSKENRFTCDRDGLQIKGVEFLPEDFQEGRRYPAIIFSHGFTGNYGQMIPYCRGLVAMGYAAFCFGFCGGGKPEDPEELKSQGETTEMTVLTEVKDLTAVITYVKSRPFVDAGDLTLAGVSQGGFVSGLTAAALGEQISHLIMLSPALCIPDHARRGCLGGAKYDPNQVPERIDCGKTILGKQIHEEMAAMDPFLALSPYKGPVLIRHGTADETVDYSYAVRAKENYGKGQCRLQLIRNMGHSMNEKQQESAVAAIGQFLRGREEILTIQVIITRRESRDEGEKRKAELYFTGYCDTPYFRGTVLPGGCDTQEYQGQTRISMRAEYTLEGVDEAGETCRIHIVNQSKGNGWEPAVCTDSRALSWLNKVPLAAVLESCPGGPTVRIFVEKPNEKARGETERAVK